MKQSIVSATSNYYFQRRGTIVPSRWDGSLFKSSIWIERRVSQVRIQETSRREGEGVYT